MAKINVGTMADENYTQHLSVWMYSIMKNSSCPEDIHFYIFDGGIDEKSKRIMENFCLSFQSKITFLIPDEKELKMFHGLKLGNHLTSVLYCKLLFPDRIKDIERIIILDADLIVEGDIKELFEFPLNNNVLGAVLDAGIDVQEISKRNLGIPKEKEYFNSGVMVVDCKKWRNQKILTKVLEFIKENPDKITVQEQDGLNFILQDNFQILPYGWNLTHPFYYNSKALKKKIGKKEFKKIISNPKIIHFTIKPWDYSKVHPLRKRYWEYLKKTPWKNSKYKNKNLKNALLKIFRLSIKPFSWETKLKFKIFFNSFSARKEKEQSFRLLGEVSN